MEHPAPLRPATGDITGVILAGGLGRRMGGADKGLQAYRGRPLAAWAVERLRPQVGPLFISANRNGDRYAAFGCPVLPDAIPGFAGPLAGLHAAMDAAATPLVVMVPCDSPHFPRDLVARLAEALAREGADLAVARDGERDHPVFCLARRALLPALADYLNGGGRRLAAWQREQRMAEVRFDEPGAFANFNTIEDLAP